MTFDTTTHVTSDIHHEIEPFCCEEAFLMLKNSKNDQITSEAPPLPLPRRPQQP